MEIMELWLFSCLSFLWPEKDTNCDAHDGAAPRLETCSWDPSSLLRRINDPTELRRILHSLGGCGGIDAQIPLSRLLRPFRLYPPTDPTTDADDEDEECRSDREEEEEERHLMLVDDAVAAVAEADSLGCIRSLISAFEFYDRDGDGVISAEDLLLALQDVVGGDGRSQAPSAAACEEMVAAFDWERVGGVCFDDFIRMMMGPDREPSSSGCLADEGTPFES